MEKQNFQHHNSSLVNFLLYSVVKIRRLSLTKLKYRLFIYLYKGGALHGGIDTFKQSMQMRQRILHVTINSPALISSA